MEDKNFVQNCNNCYLHAVLRIRDIFVRIRLRILLFSTVTDSEATFTSFFKDKTP
jgi:hypothetical protein